MIKTFIPDAGTQSFTFQNEKDIVLTGMFSSLGRALVTTDPSQTIAGVFSFPAAKISVDEIMVATEKVFIPVNFQVNAEQKLFIQLESQGPFMLIYDDSQLKSELIA